MSYPAPNYFSRRWKCRIQRQTVFRDAGNAVSGAKVFPKVKNTLYPAPKCFERLKKRRIQAQNVLRDGRNVVSGLPKDEKKALPGDAGCFSFHFIVT